MIGQTRISRRRMLALALGVGLWPLARLGSAWALPSWVRREVAPGARLVALFPHGESARAVGVEYLVSHPRDADRRVLCRAVADALGYACSDIDSLSDEALRDDLRASIHRDFASDDVVVVGGWILSRTEARICAVAALIT
jgi:hypothetical protein